MTGADCLCFAAAASRRLLWTAASSRLSFLCNGGFVPTVVARPRADYLCSATAASRRLLLTAASSRLSSTAASRRLLLTAASSRLSFPLQRRLRADCCCRRPGADGLCSATAASRRLLLTAASCRLFLLQRQLNADCWGWRLRADCPECLTQRLMADCS